MHRQAGSVANKAGEEQAKDKGQKQGDQLETQGKTLAMVKGLKSKNKMASGIWTTGNECKIKLIKTDCQTNKCER